MEKTKFRALMHDGWVYGNLIYHTNHDPLIQYGLTRDFLPCYAGTESQFINKLDKHGSEVYVGDIIESPIGRFEVQYQKSAFVTRCIFMLIKGEKVTDVIQPIAPIYLIKGFSGSFEVIGNIYQTPEL